MKTLLTRKDIPAILLGIRLRQKILFAAGYDFEPEDKLMQAMQDEIMGMDPLAELVKMKFVPADIKAAADEKTTKKIWFLERKRRTPHILWYDVRVKMQGINLKEFITAEWWVKKWVKGKCHSKFPGMKDKRPSFQIYEHTNSFFCFASGKWGSLVDFLMHNRNITVEEAIKLIRSL